MRNTVQQYIDRHQLFGQRDSLLVGVSGGADSVALLDVLLALGYDCQVAHCNFHLRGAESERDAAFTEQLALHYHLPFHKIDFDTEQYATEHHLSIEMAARKLRYGWFEQLRLQTNTQYIVVAHNADDVVETLLMNLVRGTGIDGLRGIEAKNGKIVRPFLEISRADILGYLTDNNLQHIEDSTNAEEIYLRNKFRHSVIPLLETINPAFKTSVLRTVSHLKEVAEIYHQYAAEHLPVVWNQEVAEISIPELKKQTGYASFLYEFLKKRGFHSHQMKDILNGLEGDSGLQFFSKTHRLLKDRDCLLLAQLGERLQLREEKERQLSFWIDREQTTLHTPLHLQMEQLPKPLNLQCLPDLKDRNTAWLDSDKLQFPLELRHWQEGDTFHPFGMKGRKKLSDYFIDRKFSLLKKENTWLLLSDGKVVWLVGERPDENYRISDVTENVLKIKLSV